MARRIKSFGGQKHTHPIKDTRDLDRLMYYLLDQYDNAKSPSKKVLADRNYMLCFIGFNTAFRAEDLLQLRVIDLIKGFIQIKENKTTKPQIYRMQKTFHDDIKKYVERNKLNSGDYLFRGQKHYQDNKPYYYPITRQQAHKIVSTAASRVGIPHRLGLHGMRKTFAYQYLKGGGELLTLMKMLNHDDPNDTILYSMWSTDDAQNARTKIYIGGVHRRGKKDDK